MIKKILLLLIIVYVGYNCWIVTSQGINISLGGFKVDIPSYETVDKNMKKLDTSVTELNKLNTQDVSAALDKVSAATKNYETRKQEYDLLAISASEEDIAEANKVEKYLLDFLWMRIGKYASDNDIKWKMDYDESEILNFNITGSYVSIINFIYDLENDTELNFKVEGIVIEGGSADTTVKANFIVEGINVITAPEVQNSTSEEG